MVATMKRRLQLSVFCLEEQGLKYDLSQPYRVGDWAYATNGKIIVRVPAAEYPEVAEREKVPDPASLGFWDLPRDHLVLVPEFMPFRIEECVDCHGSGDCVCGCEKCDGVCGLCDGRGVRANIFDFNDKWFDLDQFALACRDPDLKIGVMPTGGKGQSVLFFQCERFEGGLMQLVGKPLAAADEKGGEG